MASHQSKMSRLHAYGKIINMPFRTNEKHLVLATKFQYGAIGYSLQLFSTSDENLMERLTSHQNMRSPYRFE